MLYNSLLIDCQAIYDSGTSRGNGIYTIQPNGSHALDVYCRFDTDVGWTIIQHRVDPSLCFQQPWDVYKTGFGTVGPEDNFWIGNDNLAALTNQRDYMIQFDFRAADGVMYYADVSFM